MSSNPVSMFGSKLPGFPTGSQSGRDSSASGESGVSSNIGGQVSREELSRLSKG